MRNHDLGLGIGDLCSCISSIIILMIAFEAAVTVEVLNWRIPGCQEP